MNDQLVSPYAVSVADGRVMGARCTLCSTATAPATHRCPGCGGAMERSDFASTGRVFSATEVWLPVGGLEPPSVLAYVDLADGPRLLARWRGERPDRGDRAHVDVVDGIVHAEEER